MKERCFQLAVKSRPLCDTPRNHVFCGPGKYLVVQKVSISEDMYPVQEDDSYFVFVRKGAGTFTINGADFRVKEGCVCWIQAPQVLTIRPDYGNTLDLWVCDYDYQLISYFMFNRPTIVEESDIVMAVPIIGPEGKNLERIHELFEDFDWLCSRNNRGKQLMRASIIRQIEVLFAREAIASGVRGDAADAPLSRRASLYIETHSTLHMTAEQVAKAMGGGVSEAEINHELRIATGMNFKQTIIRDRLLFAAAYFLYENLPFDYIAGQSGFQTDITFYRRFKQQTGLTPQEYRDRMLCDGRDGRVYRGMIMSEILVSAINYLFENLSEHIEIEDMARDLFTSESIIRSLFREYINTSSKHVLAQFRVRYSEALLSTTDLPLIDISIESGFSSDRTFGRTFYEINGMSPGEFRRRCREREQGYGRYN